MEDEFAENSNRPCKIILHGNYVSKASAPKKRLSSGNIPEADEVLKSQTMYIENLQQQVFFLENEILYLRNHIDQMSKPQPSPCQAGDMVKKQSESQKDIQDLKLELKRKQTSIDYLMSETERIMKVKEAIEATFHEQKTAYLEEIVGLRKERDDVFEKNVELEHIQEQMEQKYNHLQGDYDGLKVHWEESNKQIEENKNAIEELQESKTEIQKLLFEANLRLDAKSVTEQDEATKYLKAEIEELHAQLTLIGRTAEHEKLLRKQFSDDNEKLIRRHAAMEAELAEIKAKHQEQVEFRASLEAIHLKMVTEVAEAKSADANSRAKIELCDHQLKDERNRNLILATQVSDEQRFKGREEQRASHLERRLEQKEEKLKSREIENTQLLRDNVALKDETKFLKDQLRRGNAEVEELKQKVQLMQISVEEFTQCTKTAARLEGQRWKQLNQLAHGIQTISKEAVQEKDL